MVLLEGASAPLACKARQYLDEADVLVSLEAGLEELVKVCTKAGSERNAINFLAEYLMRNNPRHNPAAAQRIADMRAEAERRAAEKAAKAAAEKAEVHRRATEAAELTMNFGISDCVNMAIAIQCAASRPPTRA